MVGNKNKCTWRLTHSVHDFNFMRGLSEIVSLLCCYTALIGS